MAPTDWCCCGRGFRLVGRLGVFLALIIIIIILMNIYHVLINALSTHMIHINLNTIFYTHIEHSPTKTIYIRYYMETHTHTHNTHAHTMTIAEIGY